MGIMPSGFLRSGLLFSVLYCFCMFVGGCNISGGFGVHISGGEGCCGAKSVAYYFLSEERYIDRFS